MITLLEVGITCVFVGVTFLIWRWFAGRLILNATPFWLKSVLGWALVVMVVITLVGAAAVSWWIAIGIGLASGTSTLALLYVRWRSIHSLARFTRGTKASHPEQVARLRSGLWYRCVERLAGVADPGDRKR